MFWKVSWVTWLDFINSRMRFSPPHSQCDLKHCSQPGSGIVVLSYAWVTWSQLYSVISLVIDVHYVTTCVEFNCWWQCLQKDYSMSWHWNEHLLCSHKGLETEQWGANFILLKQILAIGRIAIIPYFLAMQPSSALQEHIKDDRYPQADEAVLHLVTEIHAKENLFSHHTANNASEGNVNCLFSLNRWKKFESDRTYMTDSYSVQDSH